MKIIKIWKLNIYIYNVKWCENIKLYEIMILYELDYDWTN